VTVLLVRLKTETFSAVLFFSLSALSMSNAAGGVDFFFQLRGQSEGEVRYIRPPSFFDGEDSGLSFARKQGMVNFLVPLQLTQSVAPFQQEFSSPFPRTFKPLSFLSPRVIFTGRTSLFAFFLPASILLNVNGPSPLEFLCPLPEPTFPLG